MEVLLDALKDSLKVFPFLLLIYIIMEIIESAKNKERIEKALSGKLSPVFAGFIGLVPECGFSVMSAKLYNSGLIKTGTLLTVFLATSDEGLIVLISNGVPVKEILTLVMVKLFVSIIAGEIINVMFRRFDNVHVCPPKGDCIECGEHHEKFVDKFVLHPLYHAGITFLFILVVNVALGYLISLVGEENLTAFMKNGEYVQPLCTVVVGLIPNCASSIILAQGYVNGVISLAGLVTGLCVNAGVGLLVVFNHKKRIKRGMFIVVLLIICSLLAGYGVIIAKEISQLLLKL